MNKKINIEKKIEFTKMISEITAISLEHDLEFVDEENIEGNLIISGKYKSTIATLEEEFNYKIPIEIALTNKLDIDKSQVEITDFTYDITENESLLCNIELLVSGEELANRECDGDPKETKEIEIPKLEQPKERTNNEEKEELEIIEEKQKEENDINFINIDNSKETYGTFIVYIVRQNENINTILEKYNTTLEEVEKYNDIKDLSIGTKLIIPLLKDED